MWITRNGIRTIFSGSTEEFENHSLFLHKGWTVDADQRTEEERNYREPTTDEIIKGMVADLERYYDSKAQERRYDNRLTCALRAGYAGPFQAEGQAFAIWMDTCNAYSYTVMNDCLTGTRTIPTAQELINELPALVWPV